ncbi:MAG TPA: ABC transporter permease [Polyangiaceae bacterium]|nr:ABC transporter permease [Polyangiaceae bacterium]
MRFLLRRLGFYLLAAWVSLTLNFLIPRLAPGDPASALQARFQGRLEPSALAAMKKVFGYTDAPLYVQYFDYVKSLLHGDFGISVAYFPARVTEVIGSGLMWTLFLAGTSVVISFVLGSALGLLAAWRRGGWLDSVAPPAFIFLGAFPYFWMAMLLLFSLGFVGGWFPVRHAYADQLTMGWNWPFVLSAIHHAVLPATSIVIASLGGWLLGMRNTMIGILAEDYITMAQAKGLSPSRVMLHYAARNALLPNITGFGMALGFVLSGSLLTEIVFSYPGQGFLLFQAVKSQDFPLMQGLFLSITVAVLAANWLVDVAYVFLDPRTRR